MELLNRRSKPMFPMTYTARATLEIGSGSVCSGRAVTTTTASNQVDSAIPFSCITTPEVVASCNTTSSTSQSAVAVDPKPRSVISSSFNGLPLTRPNYGSTSSSATEEYKKSLDENGNSLQGFSSPLSGSSQHKKPRRKKSSKNETVIKSHQIDGYQGNKDLNEVLRFIESNAESGRTNKLGRAKHKDDSDDKSGKKRSTERRKDKENKVKRASSLEELSRTKLEDLTDKPETIKGKKERWAEAPAPARAPAKAERRSWGEDARDTFYYRSETAPPAAAPPVPSLPAPLPVPTTLPEPLESTAIELTEFQTVTKRRKPRRRTDEPVRAPRPPSPRHAPPSDRSNDSNDDMDSVHSQPEPAPRVTPPHPASYADIARTRHNIPDLIESCNYYAEGERREEGGGRAVQRESPAPPAPPDADGYPALDSRAAVRRTPVKPGPIVSTPVAPRVIRKEPPAPDVVGERRPPVILVAAAARAPDMDGVTFGFDINEQLLGTGARRPRCDLVRDAIAASPDTVPADTVPVATPCAALRYVLPPAQTHDTTQLYQIVDYVGNAWEDVIRCGGGKVRYFSE